MAQTCIGPLKLVPAKGMSSYPGLQGTYALGKCQGNLKFFKVRELSGNFIICQGKLNFC